ncbi:hypothetical protein EWH12_19245 [Sphingobium cupriresistens]|uniref:Uncharacterized protein n=2 Tax=Sphingobium cupriresistens TaxID=1132417 RepID=A0A8G2DXX3_9SPHN|nr:hypothetical protein [Sphingobium cupriresistens]RYM07395.1 hypothetical protein EWH12_19245 [Sphingobium cupriresistens]
MFTLIAATLFSAAFLLAMGTIMWMFAHYHDKMVAALQFEPIPHNPPVYHLRIRRPRPRAAQPTRRTALPLGAMAA